MNAARASSQGALRSASSRWASLWALAYVVMPMSCAVEPGPRSVMPPASGATRDRASSSNVDLPAALPSPSTETAERQSVVALRTTHDGDDASALVEAFFGAIANDDATALARCLAPGAMWRVSGSSEPASALWSRRRGKLARRGAASNGGLSAGELEPAALHIFRADAPEARAVFGSPAPEGDVASPKPQPQDLVVRVELVPPRGLRALTGQATMWLWLSDRDGALRIVCGHDALPSLP
jgi:hypothetical protein